MRTKSTKIRIGIDISEIASKEKTGSEYFELNLIQNILKIDKNNYFILYTYQDFDTSILPNTKNYKIRKIITKHQTLWENLYLPYLLIKDKPDIFVSLNHLGPIYCPTKYISVILDLAFIVNKETFKKVDQIIFKLYAKHAIKISDHIITISDTTKNDVLKYYKLSSNKISSVLLGFDKDIFYRRGNDEVNLVKNKYSIRGNYILFVGTLQKRKNISRLISAFAKLKNEYKIKEKLVIVGKKGWLYNDIFVKIKKLELSNSVIFTSYVPGSDLPALFSGATVFILPSLYEGFGLPLLEAMACGTPVITSKISSLPEVVEEAGIYINDPYSENEIAEKINLVVNNKPLQKELSQKGFLQAQKFSWKNCAGKFLSIIEKTVEKK